ncbi:hypothetical protein HYW76_04320 [Candidatus Pacearchaeota archaeon]|nr:hypothetical protein [Candidatus Pacearchaeota archaeon]
MKFNFRKIASVIASAVMIGSTAGTALAANYPAPFVVGGTADAAIVITSGTHTGALMDYDAAIKMQNSLQNQVTSSSTTTGSSATGGDSVNLATSARKLYYADGLAAARNTLTKNELPTVLADHTFTDLAGTAYAYTQSIAPGPATNSTFGTSGGDLDDPTLHIDVGTSSTTPLYNYTLSFTKNLNVSDATNVQGQKINLLGVDYVIGSGSTNATLYLYGSGDTVKINGGESKTITIGGKEHTVDLTTTTGTTTAVVSVDGSSKTVTKGSKYSFPGEIVVYVKEVIHPAFAGDIRQVELIVGANSLRLDNGATVKKGADETSVKNTLVTLTPAGYGTISKLVVSVAAATSKTDSISAGESFTDPVFGGLKVQFPTIVPALDDATRDVVTIRTDNNQWAYVKFTSALAGSKGEQELTYVYDNNTASDTVAPLLAHLTSVNSNGKGKIHVYEGEAARTNDWIVINSGDFGRILEVSDISINTVTAGTVTLTDAITGEYIGSSSGITVTNDSNGYTYTSTTTIDGQSYVISTNQAGTTVNISWDGLTQRTLFPRIKLKGGGWLALLTETLVPNATNVILPNGLTTISTSGVMVHNHTLNSTGLQSGINWTYRAAGSGGAEVAVYGTSNPACNFNVTFGPAIMIIEPKKWDDSSFGDYICIPLTTTGTTEIKIGDPVFNGTSSGWNTLTSDTYQKENIDKFGAFVIKEDRTNENGKATIKYPTSQMYMDILFTAEAATVTPGSTSAGSGGVVMVVKDTEVDSVKDKNLVVVGGSCINAVARKIVDATATAPICGADFTTKTSVGAGQYLIQSVESPYNAAKVAVLVAGYEASETALAVDRLKEGQVSTDKGTKNIYPQAS